MKKNWTFLSTHAQVLLWLAREPEVRVVDLAKHVGISERATYAILADLSEAGYLTRTREGRRSRYRVNLDAPMRLRVFETRKIVELLRLVGDEQR